MSYMSARWRCSSCGNINSLEYDNVCRRCVLDDYSECAAKISEACICAKMPAKMFRERFERKYGRPQSSTQWKTIDTAPEGEIVETKIHDENGARNIVKLARKGRLWFTSPDGVMYVYYTPTHWRYAEGEE
jgi:hypothetical protein